MTVAEAASEDDDEDCCKCKCTIKPVTAESFLASCKCKDTDECPSFECEPKAATQEGETYDYGPAALEQPGPSSGDKPSNPPKPGMIPMGGMPRFRVAGGAGARPYNETNDGNSTEDGGSDSTTTKPPSMGNSSNLQGRKVDKVDPVECNCHCVLRESSDMDSADCDCMGKNPLCDSWTCDVDLEFGT